MNTQVTWKHDMFFEADTEGLKTSMDAKPASGGARSAPTPKELVLIGMCGCTGMDVVSILKKMRQPYTAIDIRANAEQTETTPAVFSKIGLIYEVTGEIDAQKLVHAVELSMTKYCGVSAMLALTAPIGYQIVLNGLAVGVGVAHFESLAVK
jgi:putative redox protein